MTSKFWLSVLCCLPVAAFADEAAAPPAAASDFNAVCLIQGVPPAGFHYVQLRKLAAKKGTYGSVAQMLPGLGEQALALGGRAIINYNGGQHFGFWPWRLTRPIVTGVAIRWEGSTPDCKAAGGATIEEVMKTNEEPKKLNPGGVEPSPAETAASAAAKP